MTCGWCGSYPTQRATGLCRTCAHKLETDIMLDRDAFAGKATAAGIPDEITDQLTRYVYDRQQPGHFVRAALENDLHTTLARCPDLFVLRPMMVLLHNDVPMGWYGSPGAVRAHLERQEVVA